MSDKEVSFCKGLILGGAFVLAIILGGVTARFVVDDANRITITQKEWSESSLPKSRSGKFGTLGKMKIKIED